MPSIVKDASAMFVATTHFRLPGGAGSKMRVYRSGQGRAGQGQHIMETSSFIISITWAQHGNAVPMVYNAQQLEKGSLSRKQP
jgi:hypothetical protein